MLEQRHNTHALSSYNSSSNNHSYDFDNKTKTDKYIKPISIKENMIQISNNQINKVNDILNKYNLISEISSNKEEKNLSKIKKRSTLSDIQYSPRLKKKKNNNNSSSILNEVNSKIIPSSKDKDKHEVKLEEQKTEEFINNINNNKFTDSSKNDNKMKEFLAYKNNNRETRFNNIQKYIEDENKMKEKLKWRRKSKLFMYQQMNNSRNLVRSIKKPEISFITKIFKNFTMSVTKNYDMFSGLKLNVKNNLCFYTKKIIRREEFVIVEKKMNKEKYEKLKKEVEAEKIPTFSSINTSSSNNSISKLKIKAKTKLKSNLKKKTHKHKTLINKKNTKRKKLFLPKFNKPLRSISVHSRFSNESNKTRLTPKIPNMKHKYRKSNKLRNNVGKDTRKYSIITRLQEKFFNKKASSNTNIPNSSSLRNYMNSKSPFKNNLLNINKITEEGNKDKDKEIGENDFQKFLEEQKIKRNKQIRNFIKKQGMNSYNFFYPKEPSPLLSVFKNQCSVYPTLNINRRSSLEKEEKKLTKEVNKTNDLYSSTYRHEKISLKKIREQKEKERKKEINKMHVIEKHYGNERDCPICRLFKLRREENEELNNNNNNSSNNNYIKSIKYNKLKAYDKYSGMLSPNPHTGINLKKDFELMSRNRINSARSIGLSKEDQTINKNFNVLYEYLMQ